nr:MAG TPA: hypothetical protein [Caudoviricetes sp.]
MLHFSILVFLVLILYNISSETISEVFPPSIDFLITPLS